MWHALTATLRRSIRIRRHDVGAPTLEPDVEGGSLPMMLIATQSGKPKWALTLAENAYRRNPQDSLVVVVAAFAAARLPDPDLAREWLRRIPEGDAAMHRLVEELPTLRRLQPDG